ncbi:hypothetical protein IQ07DRAFT_76141 [Pyrenochaeta sp. DS3sAY3a]|nr:hypothetical protein IQ07DRAFT_76141 [Pyrenochaeta sp. DS3sAY3a]
MHDATPQRPSFQRGEKIIITSFLRGSHQVTVPSGVSIRPTTCTARGAANQRLREYCKRGREWAVGRDICRRDGGTKARGGLVLRWFGFRGVLGDDKGCGVYVGVWAVVRGLVVWHGVAGRGSMGADVGCFSVLKTERGMWNTSSLTCSRTLVRLVR